MNLKTIALAAASISMLAIHSNGASAQATRFYDSPTQARTDSVSEEGIAYRTERAMRRASRVEAFGAVPYATPYNAWTYQSNPWDKHTSEVKDW